MSREIPIDRKLEVVKLYFEGLAYDDGEGQALINRDELKGIANALDIPI